MSGFYDDMLRKYGPAGPPFPGRADPLAPPPGINGRADDAMALARRVPRQVDHIQRLMGCPPPVWMNTDDGKLPDGRCVLFAGSTRCAAKATLVVWIGCTVGEHLDRSSMCERHADHVQAWKTPLHCERCWIALNIVSDATVIKVEKAGS